MVATGAPRIRVLIAEDEPDVLEDYRRALEPETKRKTPGSTKLDALESDLFGEASAVVPSYVREASFDVVVTTQGKGALMEHDKAMRADRPFDVALIDVRMPPGIDGVETAVRLRKADPRIQIGIVTGQADLGFEEIAHRVMPRERIFFIRKPFLRDEIRAAVLDRFAMASTP